MQATIREGQAPAVVVSLAPGEKLVSEAGAMMFMSGDVAMDVEMPGAIRQHDLDGEIICERHAYLGHVADVGSAAHSGEPPGSPEPPPQVRCRGRAAAPPGLKRSLFSGEGVFLVHMTGPGHVTLQTLPFSRTAERVMEAAGGGQGERGGLLGQLLGE